MSSAGSLRVQALVLVCLLMVLSCVYFGARYQASASVASAYDGQCHWLSEYSRPCTVEQYIHHEAVSALFPRITLIGIVIYVVYLGGIIWAVRLGFEFIGFVVRRSAARGRATEARR